MQDKRIGWLRVLLILFSYIIIVGFFQFIGMLIIGVNPFKLQPHLTSGQDLIIALFDLIGTFFLLGIFMKHVDDEKFINLGFQTKNRLIEFNFGFVIGALILIIGYLILVFMDQIAFVKAIFNPKEIIISILLYLIVAIIEEVLFRGYVLRNLMISFNKYIALIISSLLFSIMHGFNPNIDLMGFLDLFLAGTLLGISYIYTKNLWFPIALHFSWNLTQTFLGFNVSGLDVYSIIEIEITENNLLNGGDFGFEGSVLSIFAQVIFIILIWLYYNTKQTHQSKSTL